MKNDKTKKEGELFIDVNALTLTTKGGNAGMFKAEEQKRQEEIARKTPKFLI
jgi:hypothetical protein